MSSADEDAKSELRKCKDKLAKKRQMIQMLKDKLREVLADKSDLNKQVKNMNKTMSEKRGKIGKLQERVREQRKEIKLQKANASETTRLSAEREAQILRECSSENLQVKASIKVQQAYINYLTSLRPLHPGPLPVSLDDFAATPMRSIPPEFAMPSFIRTEQSHPSSFSTGRALLAGNAQVVELKDVLSSGNTLQTRPRESGETPSLSVQPHTPANWDQEIGGHTCSYLFSCQLRDSHWRWGCCNFLILCALLFIVPLNLIKIPYYFVDIVATDVTYDEAKCALAENAVWCHGQESVPYLRSAGARSLKSFADPELFLGPHTSMGCLLLCMFGVGLMKSLFGGPHRHPWSLPSTFQLSYPFFTLFFLFCLHIVPVTEGVPNKQTGAPINELAIFVGISSCVTGIASRALRHERFAQHRWRLVRQLHWHCGRMNWWSWCVALLDLMAAPVLDIKALIGVVDYRLRNGVWNRVTEEGDKPLPNSGRGPYASLDAQFLGWMVATLCLFIALGFWVKIILRRCGFTRFEWKEMLRVEASAEDIERFDVPTTSSLKKRLSYSCGFRKLGWATLGLFLAAVALGLILTLSSTRFSTSNDFVFQYFKMPNPCVVFDHYPAKIWALMFTSFMLVTAMLWASLLWLWLYSRAGVSGLLYGTSIISVHVWYLIHFVNIYAYDLYDDTASDDNYGVINGTLTEDQVHLVGLHTGPYINLLFADSALMFLLLQLLAVHEDCSALKKWAKIGVLAFLTVCVFATFTTLSGVVFWRDPKITNNSEASFVMFLAVLTQTFKSSIWSVVGQLSFRLFVPSTWKVRASFSACRVDDSWSRFDPDSIFSLAFRFLLCVMCLTYMFANPEASSQGGAMIPNQNFTRVPGVLIFAPAVVVLSVLFGVGVWTTYVRLYLWGKAMHWGRARRRLSGLLAVLFTLNVPLVMWRILPEAQWTNYLDYPLFFLFITWSLFSHAGLTAKGIVYHGIVALCMALGMAHWSFRVISAGFLCFYEIGTGYFPPMYLKLTSLGGKECGGVTVLEEGMANASFSLNSLKKGNSTVSKVRTAAAIHPHILSNGVAISHG